MSEAGLGMYPYFLFFVGRIGSPLLNTCDLAGANLGKTDNLPIPQNLLSYYLQSSFHYSRLLVYTQRSGYGPP